MNTKDIKNGLAQTAKNKPIKNPKTIKDYIRAMEPAIRKALPSTMTAEKFTRIMLTAVTVNPKLQECSPESFCGAMMQAAQLGLEPNSPTGESYLIPYGKQCQFQIGYKGLMKLATRSGEVFNISAHTVYENDVFRFNYGRHPDVVHEPTLGKRGEPIAFYADYHTKNDGYQFEVMSVEDVQNHMKRYSKNYNSPSSPWKTNFEAMAKKTVLIQLLKYAPCETEIAKQISTDSTVKTISPEEYMDDDVNVLDLPDEVEYVVDDATGEISIEGVVDAN